MNYDLRYLPTDLKTDGNTVTGLAIVYNSPSKPLKFSRSADSFIEIINAGAGQDVITGDTLALFEHKTDNPLGRTGSNLTLNETPTGISYSLVLPDTTLGRDVRELVQRGIIRGASFYLDVPKGGDTWKKDRGQLIRTVNKLNSLPEISLVSSPAYADTSAALRHYDEFLKDNHLEEKEDNANITLTKARLLLISQL